MAKLVEKNFTYECAICGAKFSHTIQNVAEKAAIDHELEGKPVYNYKIGDFVTAKRPTDFEGAKKIVKLVIDQIDHKPAYYIEQKRWGVCILIFMREEDIEGLYPANFLPMYNH